MCSCRKFVDGNFVGIIRGMYECHTDDSCKSVKLINRWTRFWMSVGNAVYRLFRRIAAPVAYPAAETDAAWVLYRNAKRDESNRRLHAILTAKYDEMNNA